jgi:tetratricopeptide (TPR) repeat protein
MDNNRVRANAATARSRVRQNAGRRVTQRPLSGERGYLPVGYQRCCRALLRRFARTTDPVIAERTVKACLLRADAVEDQKLLQQLADRVVTGTEKHNLYRCFLFVKGFVAYRAGHADQAVDWLRKSVTTTTSIRPQDSALTDLVLAMAYQKLGRRDAARQALARALIAAEREKWKREDAYRDPDWLRAMLLVPEAEGLINDKGK